MKHILVYGMTDNPGGIEAYLHSFFARVQGAAVQLDFVSDFPAVSGAEALQARGAAIHFIPAKSKDLKGHLLGMWRLLRAHPEYKTVYFNILDAGAAVTMLPVFLLGRRIVVHSHNNDTDKKKLHKLTKPFLNLMTRFRAACSEEAAQYMFGRRSKDTLVIPNVIDAEKYRFSPESRKKMRRSLGLGSRLAVCHVGRISRQKNPLGLIDIFEAIRRKDPNALLLSVGGGEMQAQFLSYIAQKGLTDAVMCLGVRDDVADILQAADVFLLPSLYEGFGIVAVEAQAAGLPCVVSQAVPKAAAITKLMHPVSLEDPPEIWADTVLALGNTPRRDMYREIADAGYDISCCGQWDEKLLALFR